MSGPRSRDASPFGVSRGNTPSAVKRRVARSKSETPSPLDHGYQTLEHSYDGDSSLSSDTRATERLRHVDTRTDTRAPCHLLALNDTLLTRILRHVSASGGARDLAVVGATCSRLRALAWQPRLWSRLVFSSRHAAMVATDAAMRAVLGRLVNGGHGAASVTSVHLGGCARTTDRALALVARNCPRLSRLELQRCRGVTNGGILDLVTRCPHLQHLDLTGEIHTQNIV